MTGAIVCIFARAAVLGAVKTRLAATLGAQAALDAHVRLVQDTLSRLTRVDGVSTELWLDHAQHPVGRQWGRRWQVPVRQQVGDDLGARMHHALLSGLDRGCRTLVVGTDCPAIDGHYLRSAVMALEQHDVVLGPAEDGGYGLIGLRRSAPELFQNIPWGTGDVLDASLAAGARAGLSVCRLDEIWDVDTAADWCRYLRTSGESG